MEMTGSDKGIFQKPSKSKVGGFKYHVLLHLGDGVSQKNQ